MISISIDVMGGDFGPRVTIPAAILALKRNPDLQLALVGDQVAIKQHLPKLISNNIKSRFSISHSPEVVLMSDKPSVALRNKKQSSMRIAIELVRSKEADACVSGGNTGALMAVGRYILKTFSGIDRPAIIGSIPTMDDQCFLLDLGANVDSNADHLFQFALMGAITCSVLKNKERPTVALLNVGEEEVKGNEQVKQASQLLKDSAFVDYIGFVEGDDIYMGSADVIVCDGFVGNITLKASEGLTEMIAKYIENEFRLNAYTKIVALFARPILKNLARRLDPRRMNGASLLGLQGIVVKSHGRADVTGFLQAIEQAIVEVENQLPTLINQRLETLFD